jgi:hypothetical protein
VVVAIGGEKGLVSLWDVKSGRAKLSNTRTDEWAVPNQTITALLRSSSSSSPSSSSSSSSSEAASGHPQNNQLVSVTSEHNIVFHDPATLAPLKQLIGTHLLIYPNNSSNIFITIIYELYILYSDSRGGVYIRPQ